MNHSKDGPLHIVYIITKLELGGAQKVCLSLLKGIDAQGISTTLISGIDGVLVDQAQQHHSVILLPQFTREIGLRALLAEAKTFWRLVRTLLRIKKKHPRVIVHTHSTKAGLLGRWAAFFARCPIRIHTVHGFGFHDYQNRLVRWIIIGLEWMTSLITTHFVCVSQKDRSTGMLLFPRFASNSSVIRAAIAMENFAYAGRKTEPFSGDTTYLIGTISCFKPQKNLIDLLKAFHLVHHSLSYQLKKIVRLQVIGDGIMRPEIESWITMHGMGGYIELLGWQQSPESWMKAWKLFAMSSLWEGLPCVVVEARACRLPVVAYDVGGINEVIRHEANGYLAHPGDWQSLARGMLTYIEDARLYEAAQECGDMLDDFKEESMIEAHVALYQHLMDQQSTQR